MVLDTVDFGDGFSCYHSGGVEEAKWIYGEIFEDHCYDLSGLSGVPFIVDVGANIGLFSLYAKQKVPQARIIAFEPAPASLEALHRNLEMQNASDVTVYALALGFEDRQKTLTYFPEIPGNSTLHPAEKVTQRTLLNQIDGQDLGYKISEYSQHLVQVDRLSRVLSDHYSDVVALDLLKIDVEGAELEVLSGIDDIHWAKIQRVLMEIGDIGGSLAKARKLMEAKGFVVTQVNVPQVPLELSFYYVTARR